MSETKENFQKLKIAVKHQYTDLKIYMYKV